MIRPITRHGDAILRQKACLVQELTVDIQTLVDDMIDTMYAAPGIGLAAPQVGVGLCVFVMDVSSGRSSGDLHVMINPEMIIHEGVQTFEEGCLSVPDFQATVPRPKRAVVRGLNRDGKSYEIEGTGLCARALEHELDHLNGSLFLDRLRGFKKELILRRINKLKRTGQW
jgi:peptide deformylase